MLDVILWALLAFFSTFGLIEFIRFMYADWNNSKNNYHLVIHGKYAEENIEGVLKNAILSTDCHSIVIITEKPDYITEKISERYPYVEVLSADAYVNQLKMQGLEKHDRNFTE